MVVMVTVGVMMMMGVILVPMTVTTGLMVPIDNGVDNGHNDAGDSDNDGGDSDGDDNEVGDDGV